MALANNPVALGNNPGRPAGAVSPVGSSSSSTTDNALARWDGTTGTLIQNSGVTVSDVASNQITINAVAADLILAAISGTGASITLGRGANDNITLTPSGTGGVTLSSGMVRLHGSTSSFPALKRNGTGVQVRLADDSGFAAITASSLSSTTGVQTATGVSWDLGAITAGAVALDAANYIAVTIGGVAKKILIAS